MEIQTAIRSGETILGIEFGSTRIKAVLIGKDHAPIASGSHDWENRYEKGVWTYSLDDVWSGLQDCYQKLNDEVFEKFGVYLQTIGAIGFSGMMHGYLAFGKNDALLVRFRTWRNTMTEESLPGYFEQGIARKRDPLPYHPGRLCTLEVDR